MNEKVMQRVREHAEYVNKQVTNETCIFTALQGSQNYHLDDESSDVDTKTLTVPCLQSLVFNEKRTSMTLEVAPTVEHADVKDFREMVNCWRKQNINFIEILFTPYVYVNSEYEWAYKSLYKYREDIAHFNLYKTLRATCGTIIEKYHAFDHPYPSAMEKLNEFGYDPKQLSHMLRCKDFIIRYMNGESYEKCLIPTNKDYILAVKRGILPLKEAQMLREDIKQWCDKFLEEHKDSVRKDDNLVIDNFLKDIVYDVFEQSIRNKS